ncbi:hypothetical protein LVJ83_11515 [Uruburuella testudinis]|uniref:Uncharacterized protein n=1 Tax=Uruburuella testudinis TaxID=1282863 RepID=A0ABY4DXX7_9NEIS|nr:hypothetical protein [Uruburuella testudinis]UOO81546.1 hypothetical protein LVJ83_11515 [Uruburuella testudinis]
MRGFLFLKMQMPGKKRSKIGHLARLFNAADAFSGAKSTRKSNGQDTLGCPDHSFMEGFLFLKMQMPGKKRSKIGYLAAFLILHQHFSYKKLNHSGYSEIPRHRYERPSENVQTA